MSETLQLLVLADDLTGALECGAQLAQRGVAAPVHIRPFLNSLEQTRPSLPVVINCATRHLPAKSAAEVVSSQLTSWLGQPGLLLYKKTDSTLRGNLGSELEVLADFAPESPIFYVPAYPRLGRTCRGGILYLNGVPISETEFGGTTFQTVPTSSIFHLLAQQTSTPVILVQNTGQLRSLMGKRAAGKILLCDAETDRELEDLALSIASIGAPLLLAGPAAFLGAIISSRGYPCAPPIDAQSAGKCLWVCGSLHPRSQAQLHLAEKSGTLVISLPPSFLDPETACLHFSPQSFAKIPALLFQEKRQLILSGPSQKGKGQKPDPLSLAASPLISQSLGAVAAEILAREKLEILGVCGGDTCQAVLEALGITTVSPYGEIFDGVPISKIHYQGRNILLISKAGGFGSEELLKNLLRDGK